MIDVTFKDGIDKVYADGLYQYDYGQQLRIKGVNVPEVLEIHFSNGTQSEATVMAAILDEGNIISEIPNYLLEKSLNINAWIYVTDENSGETIKTIILKVKARAKPQDFVSVNPDAQDLLAAVLNKINQNIEENDRFIEDLKQKIESGYFDGEDGHTPVIAVKDGYWYIDDANTGQKAQGEKGGKGDPGDTGKSAYQIALDNGFSGTEQEWLESLKYQHSEEFTTLAEQVKENAETSSQAVKTVTQINSNIEDKENTFNNVVENANTTIDEKVQEATNQAIKAKREADRATSAADSKLDKNQGAENSGKVMVVSDTGELVPAEYKSGSDNRLIAPVEKSENPHVTDGFNTELMNLKLYGKSTQVTTTGKNLFNPELLTNGEIVEFNGSQCFKYTDNNSDIIFDFSENASDEQFVLRIKMYRNSGLNYATFIYFVYDDGTKKGPIRLEPNQLIAAYSDKGKVIKSIIKNANYSNDVYIDLSVTQLEEGSVATSYEPYTGGQPSPNPQYPQPITAISKLEGNIVGNIFNQENNQKGYYTSSGVGNPVNLNTFVGWSYICELIIKLTGQYTFSLTTSINVRWRFYIADENDICLFAYEDSSANASYNTCTFTMPDNAKKIYFSVLEITSADQAQIMLNAGTNATPYTPYVSQPFTYTPTQPMYSTQDGSISDYVDVEKGVEVYNMKKYVVTGNEEFLNDYVASGYYGRYFNLSNGNGTVSDKIFCNYLPYANAIWSLKQNGCSQNARFQIHLKFDNETLGITDDTPLEEKRTAFANYLKQLYTSDDPLYVVVVVNQTTEPIPEETLAQLRALQSYNGVTNFLCNAPVSFKYERDINIAYDDIMNKFNSAMMQMSLMSNQSLYTMSLLPDDVQAQMIDNDIQNQLGGVENE